MGYSYGRAPNGRLVLSCDKCGGCGSEAPGVRKRTCRFKVDGLPYCPAPALCSACYAALGKGKIHDGCEEGANASQAQYDARAKRLAAGEWMVSAAWGDWQSTVPTGWVGLVLRNGARQEKWRLALAEDYDRLKRAVFGDIWQGDFEALAPWSDPSAGVLGGSVPQLEAEARA